MKKIFTITALFILASCSNPLKKTYSEASIGEDLKLLKEELGEGETDLIVGTIFRYTLEEKELEGKTYKELLKEGEKWKSEAAAAEAEAKLMAEKAAKDEANRMIKLKQAVMVSCFEKGFMELDYKDFITYKFIIKNKTDKPIRAVKGSITFTNLFDDEINSLSFVYDQPIAANTKAIWNAQTDYNQFMDEDISLKNKDIEDMKVIWKPEKIIFEDGSFLE